jgi:hypothetical protein
LLVDQLKNLRNGFIRYLGGGLITIFIAVVEISLGESIGILRVKSSEFMDMEMKLALVTILTYIPSWFY